MGTLFVAVVTSIVVFNAVAAVVFKSVVFSFVAVVTSFAVSIDVVSETIVTTRITAVLDIVNIIHSKVRVILTNRPV